MLTTNKKKWLHTLLNRNSLPVRITVTDDVFSICSFLLLVTKYLTNTIFFKVAFGLIGRIVTGLPSLVIWQPCELSGESQPGKAARGVGLSKSPIDEKAPKGL